MRFSFEKKIGLTALLLVLAACSQEAPDEMNTSAPEAAEEAAEPQIPSGPNIIPTTDELGSFETPVSGVALWQHPFVPFESLVLAANGSAGLFGINFEKEGVASLDGNFSSGLTLSYIPVAGNTETIIAAEDSADGQIRFINLSGETPAFSLWPASGDSLSGTPLCFAKSAERTDLVLLIRNSQGLSRTSIIADETGSLQISANAAPDLPPVTQCAGDDRNGTLYLLDQDGTIRKANGFAASGSGEVFVKLPSADVVEIALILQQGEGGYLLAMLSSGSYEIYAYDLVTGEQAGTFTLGEFSDIAAVETISAFSADASNFGSLYREGAIAIVEGEETYALKLAPWTAVRNILGLANADRLDRRSIGTSEDSLEIDGEQLLLNLPELVTEPDVQ